MFRRATVAQALLVVWQNQPAHAETRLPNTYLICKPNMLGTLRSILILICIVISVLEEKYQPIDRLA